MAQSVNVCMFAGNLTRDPELKYLPSGAAVANFSLALNSRRKAKDDNWIDSVEYVDFELWDSGAENFAKNFVKGDFVVVESSYRSQKVEKDGQTKKFVRFRVNSFSGGKKNKKQEDDTTESGEPVAAGTNHGEEIPF